MSLELRNIFKSYGKQVVLNDLSFSVRKGEILGFLGPNGAGKTTTMKLITAYSAADSGEIKVCGINVKDNPIKTKSLIGYLPEHNPLYGDMYIKEYLTFVANLHEIQNPKELIQHLIHKTGLEKEEKKKIKMLSKGYRQRVGLAQALLHDPEVLILDEPTSGLDPNQLEDIRNLIRELGKEKTVVFSSHVMQEVRALCDRVIIINDGKIVADGPISELEKRMGKTNERIIIEFGSAINDSLLKNLPGFKGLTKKGENTYVIDCLSERKMRKQVFELAAKNDLPLLGIQKEDLSIENVFQALTK